MMTAAERLAKAVEELYLRIHNYCEMIAQSALKVGGAIISPKKQFFPPPPTYVREKLNLTAKETLVNEGVQLAHLRYFDPPTRRLCGLVSDHSYTEEDYQITYQKVLFDEEARAHTWAQELIYCPNDEELGIVHDKWFVPQIEAIRLTTQLYEGIAEAQIIEHIRWQFNQPWRQVFETFLKTYILNDCSFSEFDRKRYKRGEVAWETLYHEIVNDLLPESCTIYDCYKKFRKMWVNNRDSKIRPLLESFLLHIEHKFIEKTDLNDDKKNELLAALKKHRLIEEKIAYAANRPTLGLSYTEIYEVMRCVLGNFITAPIKQATLGEIAIFIWIGQFAAFAASESKIKNQDIFSLKVKAINFDTCEIMFPENNFRKISKGLTNVLKTWVGSKNKECRLFNRLNPETFRKRLYEIQAKIFVSRLKVQDFLVKSHPILGLRIPIALRKKIDKQIEHTIDSPYTVDNYEIYKGFKGSLANHKSINT